MRSLFDVNALIALFDPEHVHHQAAHQWWKTNQSDGWASCPLTQNGFVRVVSQPSYPKNISTAAAIDRLRDTASESDHEFWPDDVSLIDPRRVEGSKVLGPKQLTDIYLLALVVKNGGRLVTFDRAVPLATVRGAEPHHLTVI